MVTANAINHTAWAESCIGFIRSKGLEQEFTDWCGGWRRPVHATDRATAGPYTLVIPPNGRATLYESDGAGEDHEVPWGVNSLDALVQFAGEVLRLEAMLAQMREALRNAARNDKTRYNHHEPRPFDGKKPSPGTIWLTPREIARNTLGDPRIATGDDL